jgi:hypothetical protein
LKQFAVGKDVVTDRLKPGIRSERNLNDRIRMQETPTVDNLNRIRNLHVRIISEIQDNVTAIEIQDEMIDNAIAVVATLNFDRLQSTLGKAQAVDVFHRRRKVDRLQ